MFPHQKSGIDYFAMDSNHTVDRKIKLLYNDLGSDGFWVWSCLLDAIYAKNGYYFDTNDQEGLELFAFDHCKKPVEYIQKVIDNCCVRKLFDHEVYTKTGYLTSSRIQLNFLYGTYERRRKGAKITIRREIFCVSAEKFTSSADKIKLNITILGENGPIPWNEVFPPRNEIQFPRKVLHSKVKYNSKVKESKDSTSTTVVRDSTITVTPIPHVEKNFQHGGNGVEEKIENSGVPPTDPPKPKKEAPKKKSPRAAKFNPDAFPHWKHMVQVYTEFFRDKKGVQPVMAAQEFKHMHSMLTWIKKQTEEVEEWSLQNAMLAWRKFLGNAWLFDPWLQKRFSPSQMVSRYNDIQAFALNPEQYSKPKFSNNGTSNDEHLVGKTFIAD